MESPQSVVSPLKNSSIVPEPDKQNANLSVENSNSLSREIDSQAKGTTTGSNSEDSFSAALEVYIHQARDIHNICIYQKQDVYAKLCLNTDPKNTVSTKIINGGGRNPIFNENLRLNVCKVDSSLKCEIWMLSRVHNYMDDQMLGFALVPVSDVLINDGKLEKEFSLSSTDLFHSPAGFVQLSVSYVGSRPEVIPIASPPTLAENDSVAQEMDKIEFPDPKMVNENQKMVEEYISMPCSNLESQCPDNLVSSDTENHGSEENFDISRQCQKTNSPMSSVLTSAMSASPSVSSQSCETPKDSKVTNEERVSPFNDDAKEKIVNVKVDEAGINGVVKPLVSANIEPEPEMVQQDIVDMYMKSMQQFTESLAKMKLPMDFESGPTSSSNSSSDPKSPASKKSGSRVFYGSRAFF